jgi:hypothetical protein
MNITMFTKRDPIGAMQLPPAPLLTENRRRWGNDNRQA